MYLKFHLYTNVLEDATLIFGGSANFVRLACVRHAASVRPEPGSNSRLIFLLKITHSIIYLSLLCFVCSFLELSKVSYAVLLSMFVAVV